MNIVEFGKICRLCLSSKGSMTYIFQSNEFEENSDSNFPLDLRIMLCSAVKVAHDDGLPSQACKQCVLMLDRWLQFKQKIESSDATLRKLIHQSVDDYESHLTYNIHKVCDATETRGNVPSLHARPCVTIRSKRIKKQYSCSSVPPLKSVIQSLEVVKLETKQHVEAHNTYYNDEDQNADDELFFDDSEAMESQDNAVLDYRPTVSHEMLEPDAPVPPRRKRTQAPGKPHRCDTCNKSFAQSGDLHIHQRIHSGERPYICDACGKSFPSSSNLARHKRTHTGVRPFLCSRCPKSFAVRSALKEHENTHSGNKPFLCQECGKSFAQKGNLKIHEMLHTGVKPYSCNVCGKSFALRGNLKDHLNIHSCRKPFACTVCPKSFTQRSTLTEHLKVHSGVKPFSCTACCKTFAYRKTLKIHLNTHTGEKPFVCEVCNKCFSERSHLKRHVNTHAALTQSVDPST